MNKISIPTILAGGTGTRLWPLSRETYPKQFCKLFGDHSLLQKTAERAVRVTDSSELMVITNVFAAASLSFGALGGGFWRGVCD